LRWRSKVEVSSTRHRLSYVSCIIVLTFAVRVMLSVGTRRRSGVAEQSRGGRACSARQTHVRPFMVGVERSAGMRQQIRDERGVLSRTYIHTTIVTCNKQASRGRMIRVTACDTPNSCLSAGRARWTSCEQ
jgi:hypothetical protein